MVRLLAGASIAVVLLSCAPEAGEPASILPHGAPVAEGQPVFTTRVGNPLEVAVRVTDAEGLPVKDAEVRWSSTAIAPAPRTSTTDAEGIAKTTFMSEGAISLLVTATVKDSVRTQFSVAFRVPVSIVPDVAPDASGNHVFTADAGTPLEVAVHVVDAEGLPVADVAVQWSTGEVPWHPSPLPSPDPKESTTNTEGRATTTFSSSYGISIPVGARAYDTLWRSFGVDFLTGPAVAFSQVAASIGGTPGSGPLHPINFQLLDAAGLPTADFVTLTVLEGGGYLSTPGTTQLRVETSRSGWLLEGWGVVERPRNFYRFGQRYWVLGPELGTQRAKATLSNGLEQIFTAEARALYVAFRGSSPTVDPAGNVSVEVDICQADQNQRRTLTIGGMVHELRHDELVTGVYNPNEPCLFVGSAPGTNLTFPVTVTVSAEDSGGVSASVSAEVTR